MKKAGFLTRREFAAMGAALGLSGQLSAMGLGSSGLTDKAMPSVAGPASLRAHGVAVGVQVGCAVVPELLDMAPESQDPYTRTVSEQPGILVAENAMKWSSLRPSPTTYDFAAADRMFAFATTHSQLVRGHNLCWHEQLPKWFSATATKENARDLLTQHIQAVAGRYAGRVHSWDVVNEAVHVPDGRADGLRRSPWLELMGAEYIEVAFAAAAKADPQAKLTYNDYDIELDTAEQTAKRGQVLMLVKRLHARGIPIHAIGIQSHLQAVGPKPGAGVVSLIREAAKMGLEVYITELDVNSRALPGGPELQDAAVADVYFQYLNLAMQESNVKAVLTWGITDARTWLNQSKQPWALRPDGARQRPLPFDEQYQPTPVFFAMRSALDAGRAVAPSNVTTPAKEEPELYAPFAVPGSPGVPPTPKTPEAAPKP